MARKTRRTDRLPKAPLAEVVFELRWALQGGADSPSFLHSDPGLLPLLDSFTKGMKKAGFGVFKDLSRPLETGAYGVVRRFFKNADSAFPILQIGPGIFASNESSQYEWKAFKAQTSLGLRTLIGAYPKLSFFSLQPNYLEIRYIDAFDASLLGKAALFHFAERGTSLKFTLPPMLDNRKLFEGDPTGRFAFQRKLKGWANSIFSLDFGSGQKETKESIVRLETKIITKGDGVARLQTPLKFLREIDDWLEFAHGITSPFFKDFILPPVMQKFEGN